MHNLSAKHLKQRVLDVQAKFLRRRHTSSGCSSPSNTRLHQSDDHSLRKPSPTSSRSSRRRPFSRQHEHAQENTLADTESRLGPPAEEDAREFGLSHPAPPPPPPPPLVEDIEECSATPTALPPLSPPASPSLQVIPQHFAASAPPTPVTRCLPGSDSTQNSPAVAEVARPVVLSSPGPLLTARRPTQIVRRQSLLPPTETALVRALLGPETVTLPEGEATVSPRPEAFDPPLLTPGGFNMVNRRIWVRRQGGSPTMVNVHEEDLVDDVREVILKKYQNALGRSYDAPDIALRIYPRGGPRALTLDHRGHIRTEKILGPDEAIMRVLDDYYPGGQSAEEALLIEVPQRRTPRPSPGHAQSYTYGVDHQHLAAEGTDYFSAMPVSPGHPQGTPGGSQPHPNSIAVLTTGNVPQLPGSPGRQAHQAHQAHPVHRPPMGRRMNTASPTIRAGVAAGQERPVVLLPRKSRSRVNSDASISGQPPPPTPPLPPPASEEVPQKVATPPPVQIRSPPTARPKKEKKQAPSTQSPAGLLPDGAVPPIKVLIVEDNEINLRLLEAFMKRLKVRWDSAMNGKIAVDKWRAGGFHLVLMDIQLPIMNGLEATKEIRRLERVNNIGISHAQLEDDDRPKNEQLAEEDKLPESILFRSPVIIVALTASSLQSDRHEAYAAGCNDFLTKPVNFIWLERKVTEWGCMQALIDFDGWKKWKEDVAGSQQAEDRKPKKNPRMLRKKVAPESGKTAR